MLKNLNLYTNINSLEPVFHKNCIPIAFSSSDYFAPYLGTTIQSIIESSSSSCNYDLIVFTKDMSELNKKILYSMINLKNFSIRFVDLSNIFEGLKLYTPAHITIETYFRLVIPLFMKNYNKFLFLDSDIIVQEDVSRLYEFDVSNYALAATEECLMSALVSIHGSHVVKYMKDRLCLKNIDKYFQAGVMLVNTNYFIQNNISDTLLKMVINFDYRIVDQDAMNELLNDKVLWLPNEWNYPPLQDHMKRQGYLENMSDYIRKKYLAVKVPKIIHYADREKPWYYPNEELSNVWWEYARKTPFYEQILYNMVTKIMSTRENNLKNIKKISLNYFKCKLFTKITFGKARVHYIEKAERLKKVIAELEKV